MLDIIISDRAYELVKGAYDMHMHPAPSQFPRKQDEFEVIRDMDSVGMAGAVIKNHYEPTAARAIIANKYAGGARVGNADNGEGKHSKVYGSLALNLQCGGINPDAVEHELELGAKVIWMPTRDAEHISIYENSGPAVSANSLSSGGQISGKVKDVLELVRDRGAVIATGHMRVEEIMDFVELAISVGTKTILTHPDWSMTFIQIEKQVELAKKGVYIEKLWQMISTGNSTVEHYKEAIKAVGPEHIVLGTDSAYLEEPDVSLANLQFIETLIGCGFTDEEIIRMNRTNSEYLLGI